jgi:replicative DNA helicase
MLQTVKKFKNAVIESEYIKKLAEDLDIKEEALLKEAKKIKDQKVFADLPSPSSESLNINPTEKLLIKLMLEEKDLIEQIRQQVEPADFQDERTAKIVSIMFDLLEQGKNIEPHILMHHLGEDAVSKLLCESVFLPEISEENKGKIIDDCIKRIKAEKIKSRRQQLHNEIRTAQNLGDQKRLDQLMREFHELIKQR